MNIQQKIKWHEKEIKKLERQMCFHLTERNLLIIKILKGGKDKENDKPKRHSIGTSGKERYN
jgi:hypothetical protein